MIRDHIESIPAYAVIALALVIYCIIAAGIVQ
jgi:hypothetical protein